MPCRTRTLCSRRSPPSGPGSVQGAGDAASVAAMRCCSSRAGGSVELRADVRAVRCRPLGRYREVPVRADARVASRTVRAGCRVARPDQVAAASRAGQHGRDRGRTGPDARSRAVSAYLCGPLREHELIGTPRADAAALCQRLGQERRGAQRAGRPSRQSAVPATEVVDARHDPGLPSVPGQQTADRAQLKVPERFGTGGGPYRVSAVDRTPTRVASDPARHRARGV